jgi:15-cis-phytoene synthase
MNEGSVGAAARGVSAQTITKSSGSNLALAFIALPRQKRDDIAVFYSFCRVVDDIADEPGMAPAERKRALDLWIESLTRPAPGEPPLAAQVRDLIARYEIPAERFEEIIFGCEMDLAGTVYETWDDLRLYCHRVASVVGLVSIEIFGYRDPAARTYAVELGLALQLTNIIRDVGQDYSNGGRVYLPREDMDRFGYDIGALAMRRYDDAFRSLMLFEANRARNLYDAALAALPAVDRRSLVAAEIMRRVYSRLLDKMEKDGFRVLDRRYRLTRWEKAWCVLRGWLGS